MSKTIKLCGNNLIEIASYRNPEAVFHNSENPRHLKPEYDDFESYCDFKDTINPFQMYAENERLKQALLDIKEYTKEVIKEHENGEYNVSTVELAIKEHKGNIQNVLDIVNEALGSD